MSAETKSDEKSELKSFKDIKSIDDLDFDKIELIRGETPHDIKEMCLQLCKDYLSGNWIQQSINTIEVRRITGGLVNQLYYCGINQPKNNEDVPQEVAVRLYGESILGPEDEGRVRDVVIAIMFSEKNLGPKIYGLFEKGQIQKFYKHKQFFGEEQNKPDVIRRVMQKLAQIHCLNAPLKKDPNSLFDLAVKWYNEAYEKFPINDLIEEYNYPTLKKYDLKAEIKWIKGVIEKSESPVLFTHNDFRSSNLMITQPNDELVVCDYDISGYGYRGYDFVSLMREWGRKQFDMKTIEGLAIDSQFKPVIEIYVEECQRIHGKSYSENKINSVDHILKEVKIFLLFSFLFFTTMCLKGDENNKDFPISRKLLMDFVEMNHKNYIEVKDILRKQKIID